MRGNPERPRNPRFTHAVSCEAEGQSGRHQMAGRNWRDDERYRDDYWREGARNRPGYESSDHYGRSRSYEGGDWGSDRGGGPGDYGRDFARNVRRDSYGDSGYGDFQPNNPFPSNRSFDYDES